MRIGWVSNAPWCASGYGVQTALFAPRLRALGHEVAIFATYGLEGGALGWQDGITIFPTSKGSWGLRYIRAHAERWEADVVISLFDVFTANPADVARLRWCPWVPVDSWPLAMASRSVLPLAMRPIAMSRFGERMLAEADLEPAYIPHAYDGAVFTPGDKAEARQRTGIPDSAFVVGLVAANLDDPSRKALVEQLSAFARFARKHPDAVLYLHSQLADSPRATGIALPPLLQHLGLEIGRNVIVPDRYRLEAMGFPPDYMADVYRSLDVLLHVTSGEGFGVTQIEAQACGCPIISGDWTAMEDLCFGGWQVPKDKAQEFRMPQGSWMMVPRVGAIVECLELAYKKADGERQKAIRGAAGYAADVVAETLWRPLLDELAETVADQRRNPSPCGPRHRFGQIAVADKGTRALPCLEPACEAHQRETHGGWVESPWGFATALDGVRLDLDDDPAGGVAKVALREIRSSYRLHEIRFREDDVVLDVGAHVGAVSIWLAVRFPFLRVYAYEPDPENFKRLKRNIEANGVADRVQAFELAVTADGRQLALSRDPDNSGATSAWSGGAPDTLAHSTTLAAIFETHRLDRVRLLKLDCEGAEHEIVAAAGHLLERCDYIRGELHTSPALAADGRTPEAFAEAIQAVGLASRERVIMHACEIGQ